MLHTLKEKLNRTAFRARAKRALALLLAFSALFSLFLLNGEGTAICAADFDENGREYFCGHVAHTHTEDCYAVQRRTVCGLEECAGHTHTEDCYVEPGTLICGREECEGHTHTEDCYTEQSALICENTDPEHVHTESCYVTERVLSCAQEEREGHIHTPECCAAERMLICGQEEREGHAHTDACWVEEEVLVCGLEEHEHSLICYSDRSAVETEADWRASVSPALITGRWDQDLVAVAATQIGYTESTRNFILIDGVVHGYTRYGDWIDSVDLVVYGPWCASFVAFCMYYANIRNVPISNNCAIWVQKLMDVGMYYEFGEIEPRAGDLIFFYSGRESDAEAHRSTHMGIVAAVKEHSIITIEGNTGPVCWREYENSEIAQILGFGRLPENPDLRSVTDVSGRVSVSGVLPENIVVKVKNVSAEELENCGFRSEKAVCAYEISLRLNGKEYKPQHTLYVEIRPDSLPDGKLEVIHFREDDTGKLAEQWPVEQLKIENGSFSYLAFTLSRCVVLADGPASPGME